MSKIQDKVAAIRSAMNGFMIERHDEIDATACAVVQGEHCLLVGDPGTAKSMLCRSWKEAIDGAEYFERLLTKFSEPGELFGPIDIRAFKEGIQRHVTTGQLPEAHFAFIDEVFKANSAVLNTLLTIINERVFHNGAKTPMSCPLIFLLGASNELPGSNSDDGSGREELGALFDRFLYRRMVKPVASAEGKEKLWFAPDEELTPHFPVKLTLDEVQTARKEAKLLTFSTEAKEAFRTIVAELVKEGITPLGDRRCRKAVKAMQAFAYVMGAGDVQPDHCEVLKDVLWVDPVEHPSKAASIILKVANPSGMQVAALLREVEEILGKLDMKDLSQATKASVKLLEIGKKVGRIKSPDSRSEKARAYIAGKIKQIKMTTIESLDD